MLTTIGPRRPADRVVGGRVPAKAGSRLGRCSPVEAPLRADRSTSTYRRAARARAGAAARTVRASVPGPAPTSTTVHASGRPASAHQASIARATTAPKRGPTSGLVRKSPRRPARPPVA